MSKRIGDSNPLLDLKVALARLTESYRFPSDEEFSTALQTVDLYDLRVCKVVLDGLENYGNNEPSDTSTYSIEHILPQNQNLPAGWREMLGVDWEEIQSSRLHKLGNLTLTGYNSTYSDKPFDEKKIIDGGFNQSSVRLNQFVRDQSVWTDREIDLRTSELTDRSLVIWQSLEVDPSSIRDAELHELKLRSEAGDTKRVQMTAASRSLYEKLASRLHLEIPELIELAEPKSVSYFAPEFFMELVPRKYSVQLVLSQKYSEIQDPAEYLEDAATYTFVVNSSHFSPHHNGILVALDSEEMIDKVMPLIHQSVEAARAAE
jgi:predicted transport protein